MTQQIIIHCKSSLKDVVDQKGYIWRYSEQFGKEQIEVVLNDIDELSDEDLSSHYGLDYSQVISIENLSYED